MKKIIRNRIKCKKCGEIIESTSRHDLNSVNAVRSLSMAEKITFEESEIKTIMKN